MIPKLSIRLTGEIIEEKEVLLPQGFSDGTDSIIILNWNLDCIDTEHNGDQRYFVKLKMWSVVSSVFCQVFAQIEMSHRQHHHRIDDKSFSCFRHFIMSLF